VKQAGVIKRSGREQMSGGMGLFWKGSEEGDGKEEMEITFWDGQAGCGGQPSGGSREGTRRGVW